MTTRELLETLDRTKTARGLWEARNLPRLEIIKPLPIINWKERQMQKTQVLIKYLKMTLVCFLGLMLFLSPLFIAYPTTFKSMMVGLPPMLFFAVSWMVCAWYAWDKERHMFLALTLGASPVRIGLGIMWASYVMCLPGVESTAFVAGMMLFWIVFSVPEFAMIAEFGERFLRHADQVEP